MYKNLNSKFNDYAFNLKKSFVGINLITAYHTVISTPYFNPLIDDPHWKQLMFVFYILKGSFKMIINNEEIIVPENSIFFGKTSSTTFLTDNHEEAEFICFHFQLFNYDLPFYKTFHIESSNTEIETINRIIKCLRMQSELGIGSANAIFMDLLFGWLRKIRSSDTEKTPHYNVILDAELYINEHITENLTIEEISKHFNFSEKHFRYLFNRIIGISPKKYMEKIKCERAFELLKNTSLSVAEIAEKLNYSSPQHLATSMKKIFNLAPSDCRKTSVFIKDE